MLMEQGRHPIDVVATGNRLCRSRAVRRALCSRLRPAPQTSQPQCQRVPEREFGRRQLHSCSAGANGPSGRDRRSCRPTDRVLVHDRAGRASSVPPAPTATISASRAAARIRLRFRAMQHQPQRRQLRQAGFARAPAARTLSGRPIGVRTVIPRPAAVGAHSPPRLGLTKEAAGDTGRVRAALVAAVRSRHGASSEASGSRLPAFGAPWSMKPRGRADPAHRNFGDHARNAASALPSLQCERKIELAGRHPLDQLGIAHHTRFDPHLRMRPRKTPEHLGQQVLAEILLQPEPHPAFQLDALDRQPRPRRSVRTVGGHRQASSRRLPSAPARALPCGRSACPACSSSFFSCALTAEVERPRRSAASGEIARAPCRSAKVLRTSRSNYPAHHNPIFRIISP